MAFQVDQGYAIDQYGGFSDLPVPGGGTGFFRLGQIGDRWTFVTPEGNAYLYKGLMVWNITGPRWEPNLKKKYGDARNPGQYPRAAFRRAARTFGFNTIGWGALAFYQFPVNFLNFGRTEEVLGMGWPMFPNHASAHPGVLNDYTVKQVLRSDGVGVKLAAWPSGGQRGAWGCVDMGDPHWGDVEGEPTFPNTTMDRVINKRKGEFIGFDIAQSPWLIANSPDDGDFLNGVKGGVSIHHGWVSCIVSPYMNTTPTGIPYDGQSGRTDTLVYCKRRAQNWLQNKYGSIQALNSAWGSNYTTFDSSNPSDPLSSWNAGTGTGFLDEDGVTHSWMKMPTTGIYSGAFRFHNMADLRSLPVAVKNDLDQIMEANVEVLFKQYAIHYRRAYPNHLLMSPSALKHTNGFYKPGVLRAAGRVFDYLHMDYTPAALGFTADIAPPGNPSGPIPTSDVPEDLVRSYDLAGIPIVAWMGHPAFPDSAAARQTSAFYGSIGETARMRFSQEAKGGLYAEHLDLMFSSVGADGKKFWLGFDNWGYIDQHAEFTNWGFLTEGDNAYDGKQTKTFGLTKSVVRRHLGLPNRHLITDETGHPLTRWPSQSDMQCYERHFNYGDSVTLIRAGTRKAELDWLSLVEAESPPVTGRTHRIGGRAQVGGRIR
jgi:hypothetical protein